MSANLKHAAIIGAGQLGRRHLQGLVKSKQNLLIHVVDPFLGSRKAVGEFVASADAATLPQIQIHASVMELTGELDFVVIATTASERLKAIEQVTSVCKIRYMVLEKFLFNDSADYPRAEALISQHNITAWVNTPRRSFEVYRELQAQTSNDRLLHFCADGGDWGLCCNSVHFIDLAQYLSGGVELRALKSSFDNGVLPSKREGYVELTGEICGEVGSASVCLRSIRGSVKPINLALYYERQTVFIAEGLGVMWHVGPDRVQEKTFRIPYQSEMTGLIADQLLTTGTCELALFMDSVAAHVPLLHLFAAQAGQVDESYASCMIT